MQTIYKGISHLSDAIRGASKVLIVCDSSFPFLNIRSDVEGMSVPYVMFSNFSPNPLYEDVCKGVDLYRITKCDTILAVGGGSSMDVAKCIKLYCQMGDGTIYLNQEYKDTGIPLIAVPTTAGTGSESTRYAVIYYDGKKQSVTHDSIIPNIAILESKVLKTLPLYQKKCTLLDALCQGIESWWSVNSTDESKQYSKIAVETIIQWWREYIFENTDRSAEQIMTAANYAGRAICITQTTAPHAFSYKMTSLYRLPHGHAVAIGLPVIWKYMTNHLEKCIDDRGVRYLQSVFSDISKAMNTVDSNEAIASFVNMLRVMDIKNPKTSTLSQDIEMLSKSVNPLRLKNNPVLLDEKAIMFIYSSILQSL